MIDEARPEILNTMIPVVQREWYPFSWPEDSWFTRKSPDAKKEIDRFRKKVRKYAEDDFFFFCEHIMRESRHLHLYVGLHDELCHILQYGDDALNLLPRGHLKSTIGAMYYSLWRITLDPNVRIVIYSATSDVVKKFLEPIKQHITRNRRLRWLFPEIRPARKPDGKMVDWTKFTITMKRTSYDGEPTVWVGSVLQPFTGAHCDVIIFDDIITKKTAQTVDKLMAVKTWHKDVIHLLDPGYRRVYNGTRKHLDDLYGDLIRTGSCSVYRRKHKEDGKYIWPEPTIIKNIQDKIKDADLDAYDIACELDNDPISRDILEFQPQWIQRWNTTMVRTDFISDPPASDIDLIKEWTKNMRIVMGCDPARSEKKGSSNMAMLVVGIDAKERMFGLELVRDKFNPQEGVAKFIEVWKRWKPRDTLMETYGGDSNFRAWVVAEMNKQELPGREVKEYYKTPHSHKNDRILELQMPAQRRMIWLGEGEEWDEMMGEFLRFRREDHSISAKKDCIDILSYIYLEQYKAFKPEPEKPVVSKWKTRMKGSEPSGKYAWLLN